MKVYFLRLLQEERISRKFPAFAEYHPFCSLGVYSDSDYRGTDLRILRIFNHEIARALFEMKG